MTGSAVPLPLGKSSWGEYQALAASERLLIVGGATEKAVAFDRKTLAEVATLDVKGAWYHFQFSPDGQTLIGDHLGRELIIYETERFTRLSRFDVLPNGQYISALAIHPKLPVVAVSGWDRLLKLYSFARGEEGRLLFSRELGQASALAFAPAGDELLVAISGAPKNRIVKLSVTVQ